MTCRGKAADDEAQIDGTEATPKDHSALPCGLVVGGVVAIDRLLSRARIQHLRFFFPRVDLLLRRRSAANGGRSRTDRSHRPRGIPHGTSAFVPKHGDLLHVRFVGAVL